MQHSETLNRLAALDAAVHNPARLMIIFLLSRKGGMDYLTLMRETQLSSGNITTHLNKLLASDYIKITKSFIGRKPHTAIELTAKGKQAYQIWGEMILAALPADIHDTLRKRIVHQELDLSPTTFPLKIGTMA